MAPSKARRASHCAALRSALALFLGAACSLTTRKTSVDSGTAPEGPPTQYQSLLELPGFKYYSQDFLSAFDELYFAKPILIQDYVAHDPWKVLCAVMLLNKTTGAKAVPVFFNLMKIWPTPRDFAVAPQDAVEEIIRTLGLSNIRSERLITLSRMYINDPPRPDLLRKSRCKTTLYSSVVANGGQNVVAEQTDYKRTPVSHLPGCGPYALDSWRIFCASDEEWKSVLPKDKELKRFLRWKWAYEKFRQWDPELGPGNVITLDYVRDVTALLSSE
ncbi:hypothetical protein SCP_1103010 [Sparassis crispa]|uniref:HhH-GPD domain-containing protein n=1 Tax=Sparassis crispa TaxID=139825 RepID=A0A401GZN5_9APHY|nr:hypothetical protein SCP_1103010 [Sparassis crispa]GBE87624.1 hypothetical protein SCP_1103010 [Sparassis crispa]